MDLDRNMDSLVEELTQEDKEVYTDEQIKEMREQHKQELRKDPIIAEKPISKSFEKVFTGNTGQQQASNGLGR